MTQRHCSCKNSASTVEMYIYTHVEIIYMYIDRERNRERWAP